MSFRKNLNEQIYVKDWLKWKPYSSHTRYDKDFVAIANEVKNLLQNHPGGWFHSFDYRKEDYKNLALLLTSYFEDYISEIGIWKAYIDYNKRLFGKYLPFYDLEEYDPDDINHQDMAFLIWYFMCVNSGRFFGPDAPDILDISKDLFRLLEPKIEEVFVSEFYDSYFNIPDDIDFFELKNRLKWFALHSYLPGFEFSLRFAEDAAEYFEKNPEMGADPDMIGKMVYAFQEDYLYSKRSKLSAFSTLEWFSAVATCSEKMKQNILDLRKRVMSLFLYEGHDAQYYQFSQLQTKKLVSVHKESFTMNTRKTKEGESFFLTLVEWQGDWWLTGTLMGWGKPASDNLSDFDQDLGSIPFYLYSLEEQTGIIKNTDTMEANFLDYFHDQFILVKNQQELQKAMDKFLEYNSDQLFRKRKNEAVDPKLIEKKFSKMKKKPNWGAFDFDSKMGSAIVFIPGAGITIDPDLPELIRLMQKKRIKIEEQNQLFFSLFGELPHPDIARILLAQYPVRNIRFPIAASRIDPLENTEFLLRFLNPDAFGEPIPLMRNIPE